MMSKELIERVYREHCASVELMVSERIAHVQEEPDCVAAPMCIGPAGMQAMMVAIASDRRFAVNALLSAIGLLAQERESHAETRRRLEVQRDLTADVIAAMERAEARARVAEEGND